MLIASVIAQAGIAWCFSEVVFTAYFAGIPIYNVYKDAINFREEPVYSSLLIS
jgi:hypothetical protein